MVPHRDEWIYFPDGGQQLVHAARKRPNKSKPTIQGIIAPDGSHIAREEALFSVVDDAAAEAGTGARHGTEIPHVFDTLSIAGIDKPSHESVARTMNAT